MKYKYKTIGKALSLSIVNQIISSGTNFALGIYLVRVLSIADYGMYGIGFAVSLFYAGLGNALFLTQMVVHTPEKNVEDRLPFAGRIFIATMIFGVLSLVFAIAFFMLAGQISIFFKNFIYYGIAVSTASVCYLLKDFFVRHSYNHRREIWAVKINISVSISTIVLLGYTYLSGNKFEVVNAVWIYAVSQFSGIVMGFWLAKLPLHGVRLSQLLEDMKLNWHGGRWAIGGVFVTWLQSQAYMYVTAVFVGPMGVGQANAARLLISPFQFLLPAINQITMPRLVSQRVNNSYAMKINGAKYTLVIIGLGLVYVTFLEFANNWMVLSILGDQYSNIEKLVSVWCIVLIAQLARDGASTLLQGMKEFKLLTLFNVGSSILSIGAAAFFAWKYGVVGAVLGTGIGEAFLAISLWLWIKKYA